MSLSAELRSWVMCCQRIFRPIIHLKQDKLFTRGRAGMRGWVWAGGLKPLGWCGGDAGSISCSQLCAGLRDTLGLKTSVCSPSGDRDRSDTQPSTHPACAWSWNGASFGDWHTHTWAVCPSSTVQTKLWQCCALGTQVISCVVLMSTFSISLALLKLWISFPSPVLLQGEPTSLFQTAHENFTQWAALSLPVIWHGLAHETGNPPVPWASVRLLVWYWLDWLEKSAAFITASTWAGAGHSLGSLSFHHCDLCLPCWVLTAQLW